MFEQALARGLVIDVLCARLRPIRIFQVLIIRSGYGFILCASREIVRCSLKFAYLNQYTVYDKNAAG